MGSKYGEQNYARVSYIASKWKSQLVESWQCARLFSNLWSNEQFSWILVWTRPLEGTWNSVFIFKVKFTLQHAMMAQSREEVFLHIHDAGARWGWLVNVLPRPLHLRKRPGTHWTGGFMGLRAGLDGYGRSPPPAPSPGSNHKPPSQQQVAIPTTLSWPLFDYSFLLEIIHQYKP